MFSAIFKQEFSLSSLLISISFSARGSAGGWAGGRPREFETGVVGKYGAIVAALDTAAVLWGAKVGIDWEDVPGDSE